MLTTNANYIYSWHSDFKCLGFQCYVSNVWVISYLGAIAWTIDYKEQKNKNYN